MKKTNILFISAGYGVSPVISGGEIRLQYLAKFSKPKYNITLLTTTGGEACFSGRKLFKDIIAIEPWFNKLDYRKETKLHRFLEYGVTLFNLRKKKILDELDSAGPEYLYTSSDFFVDVGSAVFLKKRYLKKWAAMIHMRYDSPFKRPGNFILNAVMYMMQKRSFRIIAKNADVACVLDNHEGREIAKVINKYKKKNDIRIHYVKNGIFLDEINSSGTVKREKDRIVMLGSNRYTKGLIDIIPIMKEINKKKPGMKVLVYGYVTGKFREELESSIKGAGIENVSFIGPVFGKKKFRLLKQSNIYLSTSHEESWNISLLEALACGCRVVAYDLDAYHIYRNYILKAACFDKVDFSGKVLKTLAKKGNSGTKFRSFLKEFDWKTILNNEIDTIIGRI